MGLDTALEPPIPVDLCQVRCAVAALVDCVGHDGLLSAAGLRRLDLAVKILSRLQASESRALRRAVDRILDQSRARLVVLHRAIGVPTAETARAEGYPASTIRQRRNRAEAAPAVLATAQETS